MYYSDYRHILVQTCNNIQLRVQKCKKKKKGGGLMHSCSTGSHTTINEAFYNNNLQHPAQLLNIRPLAHQ